MHKETHQDSREICQFCGLNFRSKKRVKMHIHRNHQNENQTKEDEDGKVYSCKYCPVTSPFRFFIRKHLESHKDVLGFECEECGKKYVNAQGLSLHKKLVHHQNEKCACPHCGKKFGSQPYMNSHIKKSCKMVGFPEKNLANQLGNDNRLENSKEELVGNT